MRNYYINGDWNAICDRCGFKYKASQLREEWTGVMTCPSCWEPRHPQTLIRSVEDNPSVPWARPEPDDIFIALGGPLLTQLDEFLVTESGALLITET